MKIIVVIVIYQTIQLFVLFALTYQVLSLKDMVFWQRVFIKSV